MTAAPKRIQRSRAKGWRMPPNSVSVTRPGPWGNPFRAEKAREAGYQGTDAELAGMCCAFFRNAMLARLPVVGDMPERLHKLRGKNLACWCPLDQPCHADVLIELANG
jgi:hypothetical protein